MATLKDVARMAGTSVAAASVALRGPKGGTVRVSDATVERVRAAAEELGYRPNAVARGLVTGRSGAIGLALPYSAAFHDGNPFSDAVRCAVVEAAVRCRVHTLLYTGIDDYWARTAEWSAATAAALPDHRVDGLVIVMPPAGSLIVSQCLAAAHPVVAVVCAGQPPQVPTVNCDDEAGGRVAVEHLLSLGHRRIAHLSGGSHVATAPGRLAGYTAALREAGIALDPELVTPCNFDRSGGWNAMATLLRLPGARRPTAVFAANDLAAEGAMDAIRAHGLTVPDDISVVGFDDLGQAAGAIPPLTTVRMPVAEMCFRAVDLLVGLINRKPPDTLQVVFPAELIVRSTTAPPRPG